MDLGRILTALGTKKIPTQHKPQHPERSCKSEHEKIFFSHQRGNASNHKRSKKNPSRHTQGKRVFFIFCWIISMRNNHTCRNSQDHHSKTTDEKHMQNFHTVLRMDRNSPECKPHRPVRPAHHLNQHCPFSRGLR
jgi:hypothetical protein